ncbi:hypothetical protein V8G54_014220 [Vigna mungo]|uniref:Disease resistance protein winged helix domain-containing protein n=1 Tax=Vigna mungo TaxID=3915 RepID=A0AAQ3NG77_VIGMU
MRALKLSYFNLELSLRRCFSFCAIFPKGFEIVKEELIHLWMANGFIKYEGNVEVEDVANNVWRKLYRRSFFQEAKSDKLGMIKSCKIHDLFYDLAKSIMGEECVMAEEGRCATLACLESLWISNCPELVALPSNMSQLSALRKVSIMYCCTLPDGLQRVPFLRWRETGEDWQYIKHIPKLELYFWREPTFCGKFNSLLRSVHI